ncbi:precorrin-6A synthase (deacetylating) [Nocardioides antri]|uniref:Precorrin-6A synthase (Deacetylating) n=1 Tax=Nocardioides antri TaxID=2607659 RepID=A0A5B1M1M7_9ACTN|nr:precorrin-6A synthase (deacetylating) [Nocardioides antri]KAA1426671.1 precorrin-6A synthase (deacetylating) [Nocardioides antri]
MTARLHVLGMGMGPQHVTPEVANALRSCDYVLALAKRPDDELVAVRQEVCAAHGVPLVVLDDPERDRSPGLDRAAYEGAVADWYAARLAVYRQAIEERGGVAGMLVWGDPSLYDGTLRVVTDLGLPYQVWPGISAPQVLAARHRIVLHEVGRPVHVTPARRLREAVAAGQENLVVMLTAGVDLDGLDDWTIWWGANLGGVGERLVGGRVGDVADDIAAARAAAKAEAGWVMDLFLLRRGGQA